MNDIPCLRRTEPHMPVNDSRFKWSPHGDCQSIWRRYGWLPVEEQKAIDRRNQSVQYAHIARMK